MKQMKRALALALCLLCLGCAAARADEAGVLTETELSAWLNGLLLSTVGLQPLNDPVGEEALTDDGYAFLYPMATLYYDKPVLDAQSVLRAVAVTDEALDMPRGVRLGAPAEMLMAAYGWQNPGLLGDNTFAPLYTLSQLPQAAYWALAQREGGVLQGVQCAIHVRLGEDRYTDTGVLYTVEGDVVTGIRVYGISAAVSGADVQANLSAVGDAPAGDTAAADAQAAQGVTAASAAEPFGMGDLEFSRMRYLTLTEKGAAVLFGAFSSEDYAPDGDNWLHTLTYPGAVLVFSQYADHTSSHLEALTFTGEGLVGPRGLAVGMELAHAMALFSADGQGRTAGGVALLYGDGQNTPYGTLERTGDEATLCYAFTLPSAGGAPANFALRVLFANERLTELMLYRY